MFNIECIIYLVIVIYSLVYQIRVFLIYKQDKKIKLKDASGLYVAKDVLNKHDLGTLYTTKIKGKYSDHYDIERNVIRLSEEIYDESNLSSLSISFYQAIKAITFNNLKKRKEEKIKFLIMDYVNKISFVVFIIGAASKALDVMTLSLLLLITVIIIKYTYIGKESDMIEKNIDYVKKEYKIKNNNINKLEKNINTLLYNELSLHIVNNKY